MIAVIQRVTQASVSIPTQSNSISHGYLVLLGVADNDTSKDAHLLANKTIKLRLMSDSQQKMNLSLTDSDGELLLLRSFRNRVSPCRGAESPRVSVSRHPPLARRTSIEELARYPRVPDGPAPAARSEAAVAVPA